MMSLVCGSTDSASGKPLRNAAPTTGPHREPGPPTATSTNTGNEIAKNVNGGGEMYWMNQAYRTPASAAAAAESANASSLYGVTAKPSERVSRSSSRVAT